MASLFALVVYRAIHLSFTHDESLSYEIIKGNTDLKGTANYHYLNTVLMNISSVLFGDSEISLRLPNVISYLVYLIFCYGFLKNNPFIISILVGVPLLLLNPYMIDFFSLARGYGLSFAAMMGSTYFLIKEIKSEFWFKDLKKHFILSMFFASIGLAANLTLLNFFLSLLGLFSLTFIVYYFRQKSRNTRHFVEYISLFILFVIPVYFAVLRLFNLKNNQQLYYGTDTFDSTLYSISLNTFDFSLYIDGFPEGIVMCVKLLFIVTVLYSIITKASNKKILLLQGVISSVTFGLFLENILFEAQFPCNRTAIYLAPLFGLLVYYFSIDVWLRIKIRSVKYAVNLIFVLSLFIFLFNFLNKIKINQVREQANDANIKDAVETLVKVTKQQDYQDKKLTLAVNWIFYPSTKYYINTRNLPFEAIKIENEDDYNADYIYEFIENIKTPDKKLIKAFDLTPTGLYKSL